MMQLGFDPRGENNSEVSHIKRDYEVHQVVRTMRSWSDDGWTYSGSAQKLAHGLLRY